jgi:hypothetical protein
MAGKALSYLHLALFGAVLTVANTANAVDEFRIEDINVELGDTNVEIPIIANLDRDAYAFSVALAFDDNDIRITEVRLGADVQALNPDFEAGQIDNNNGTLMHGVVFGLSAETIDVHVNSGNNRELLVLVVDILADDFGSTTLNLREGSDDGERNVVTDINGVSHDADEDDGRISFIDPSPTFVDLTPNSGQSGNTVILTANNVDAGREPITITLCGNIASFTRLNPQTLLVTVPTCATTGPTDLVVTTSNGAFSFTETGAFNYLVADSEPIINSKFGNAGSAGQNFLVEVQNVTDAQDDAGELEVFVCGVPAVFTLLAGAPPVRTLSIIAPACSEGGVQELRVCTNRGCATCPDGFTYPPAGGQQVPGDCNQDGGLDLSDGVCLFGFLFTGSPVDLPCGNGRPSEPGNILLVDFNGDGGIDLSDGVAVLLFLFQAGPAHPLGRPPACVTIVGCDSNARCP